MEPLIIRSRKITAEDLPIIQAVVNEHWDKGRTHISREQCKIWNWVQPSGRLKDMACRELLLTLYRKRLIKYPPAKCSSYNVNKPAVLIQVDQTPINCTLKELGPAPGWRWSGTQNMNPLYNSLVDQFHYLGYSQIVGNHLKYIAFAGVVLRCPKIPTEIDARIGVRNDPKNLPENRKSLDRTWSCQLRLK